MYLDFYQLKRAPFPLTPDPAFFFGSASHRAALDALAAGIATRQGVVTITGARGVGKTTLVHTYLARVALPLTTIVSWHASLSFMEILTLLARRLAVSEATSDAATLLAQLQQRLRDEAHRGRTVALIIDEAQHLHRATLARLPLLMHLPPATEPLLVLVLVFGAKRIPEIGSSLGQGIKEFKRSLKDVTDDRTESRSVQPPPPTSSSLSSGGDPNVANI